MNKESRGAQSESDGSEEESGAESHSESGMEYSQEQLEEAERNLEEVTSEDLEDASSETTGSGSKGSGNETDDEVERTIFMKDIDYDLREDDLIEQMKRLGEVVRVTIPLTHNHARNKGFAYVEFKSVSDAKKALKLDGTELLGRTVTVSQARPRGNMRILTVFVKNLAYNTRKEDLKEHFGKFGKVYNISLPVDTEHPDRNKGFCFVEYNDADVVSKVMKSKHVINGRTLYLSDGNKNEDRNAKRNSDRLYGRRSDDERRGRSERIHRDHGDRKRDTRSSGNRIVFDDQD